MIEAKDSLALRVLVKTTASCQCSTKTNEHLYHDPNCLYRILMEVLEKIDPDSFVTLGS